jgi:hypothetical protein
MRALRDHQGMPTNLGRQDWPLADLEAAEAFQNLGILEPADSGNMRGTDYWYETEQTRCN